ncbi:MAG: type II secretion system F family protein [Chloroflexi bacterium]|nr:type II secretion system F family protein [Chloroflexota bacterium]
MRLGYRPLKINPSKGMPNLEEIFPSFFKVSTGEIIRFSRQMATILASGGNLLQTLDMLQAESRNRVMKRTLLSIRDALDGGMSFSAALAQHPKLFNHLFVSVVEVGEYTGHLGPALEQLAAMLEKAHEAKQKAIRTMMYPMAIMLLSFLTLGVLMVVAMPPLLAVFEDLGTDVPIMTKVAISGMGFAQDNMMKVVLGFGAMVAAYIGLRRFPSMRFRMDTMMVKLPIIGKVVVSSELARFSRTASMLLGAGVSISTVLQLGISGISNRYIKAAFVDAEANLMNGNRLADALFRHDAIPSMFTELVMIGEESNSLAKTMTDAAETYEKLLDQQINGLVATLEPISTLAVGGIVGFIAFSMFVPIYSGLDGLE